MHVRFALPTFDDLLRLGEFAASTIAVLWFLSNRVTRYWEITDRSHARPKRSK